MVIDEQRLHSRITRHQQGIFALIVYLLGGDREKAYTICVESFAQETSAATPGEPEELFRARLARIAVNKSRFVKAVPSFAVLDTLDIPGPEKNLYRILLEALQYLDFDARALVLLRDQLNFTHKEIALIMAVAEPGIKLRTEQARNLLRHEIEKVLNRS
jgi:DNA-directed RNA polymerase specialized sigma24 family protein